MTCIRRRQRDNEIASLRLMLSERDEKINSTMTELAEVHEQLRCQESSLQQAYNQLADASRDKARVRQQLLENQTELTGVCHLHIPEAHILQNLTMNAMQHVQSGSVVLVKAYLHCHSAATCILS